MAANKKMIFRGARIRFIDIRRKGESAPYVKIKMTADLSAPIKSAFGWEPGDGESGAGLRGNLNAISMVLAPNQRKLAGMEVAEVQLNCTNVHDFKWNSKLDKDGAVKSVELTFEIVTNDPEAEAKMGAYWREILGGDAALSVMYNGIGKQTNEDAKADDEGDEA